MSVKRMSVIAMAAALGAIFSAPLAVADTPISQARTAAHEQISEELDRFETAAANMRTDLDRYVASMRNHSSSIQLHSYNLNDARLQVNSLGRQLDVLEALSSQGTELQQAAIREARPHLEAVADHLQTAMLMHNDDRLNVRSQDFRETVNEMYESANNLYVKVDAITDYEKARNRAVENTAPITSDDV
jgi:hypothetical protein